VVDVDFVAMFPDLAGVNVWLKTETDAARDALLTTEGGVASATTHSIRERLREVGFAAPDLDGTTVTVQSSETVQRDFDGSWFYAMR
jgi:hypothetical protein